MEDAFATLSLPRRLSLIEDEVRSAYLTLSKSATPEQQEALNAARSKIETPDKRLRHYMELAAPPEVNQWRAVGMPDSLMNLFMNVGAAKQRADALLARREAAQSSLAKALLQPAILAERDAIESLAASLASLLEETCAQLPALDNALCDGSEQAWHQVATLQAHLAYLMKWQAQVRELLLRLA